MAVVRLSTALGSAPTGVSEFAQVMALHWPGSESLRVPQIPGSPKVWLARIRAGQMWMRRQQHRQSVFPW
jgi:hypothetical protein